MAKIAHPNLADVSLSQVLSALGDPVRLKIVQIAAIQPQPCHVFQGTLSKSTLSHHMKILRKAGIIRQQAEGTCHLTSLRKKELDERFPGVLKSVLKSQAELDSDRRKRR
jgi:DNA-binding transcriptional ArsR family regulator